MPAKKRNDKEDIIRAAIKVIRRNGMEGLNVRDVAKECKCSTQPIYHVFGNVGNLKKETTEEMVKIFDGYIKREIESKVYPEYKAVGMGYIRFAKEEEEIFKYLFMRNRASDSASLNKTFDDATYTVMRNYGLYKDDSVKLHTEMWAFVHGIATMFATGFLDWDWKTVEDMVTDVFLGLIGRVNKNQGK